MRFDIYRLQEIDKIKNNDRFFYSPYLRKLHSFAINKEISDIQLERIKTDFILELDSIREELSRQLILYKSTFGDLNE